MFVIVRSLKVVGKAGAYPSVAPLGAPLKGRLLALPTNIGVGLKGLPRTNTLAYYVTAVKSLKTLAPLWRFHKTFLGVIYVL